MKKITLLAFVALILFVAGCNQSQKIHVKFTNLEKEIGIFQNIIVHFNKDICPENQLNQWDSLTYFTIEPPVFGRYTWTAPDELVFSPAMGFAPATKYSIKLNPSAFSAMDIPLKNVPKDAFHFNTAGLTLNKATCFWNIVEDKKCLQFLLDFNYEVTPASLRDFLKIKLDEKYFDVTILNNLERGDVACCVFYSDEKNPAMATVEIGKGIGCVGCGTESQNVITVETAVPSLDNFGVVSYETNNEAYTSMVILYTSQPVESANLSKFITVKPNVNIVEISAISGGILIKGHFDQSKNYTVTALKGLKSRFGITLQEDYSAFVSFEESLPFLAFEDENATYLSLKGERNLVLTLAGVKNIELSVFKIYENNIFSYLNQGTSWDWTYEDDEWRSYSYWPQSAQLGDPVSSKQIAINSLSHENGRYFLKLNPEDLKLDNQYKGLYVLVVEDKERAWLQSSITLSMSDIGLIVRQGISEVMTCAVSIQNGQPLSGVKITLISDNNQVITSGTTNAEGVITFDNKKMNGFRVGMITGKKGNDYNFLHLDRSQVNVSRYELSGKWTKYVDFDVFMYGDRQLYRPGDSVHINAIARGWNFDIINDVSVVFKLQNPLGETVEKYRKTLNANGSATLSFLLPSYAPTGSWNITLENAAGVAQKNYLIRVEEFMPERIKVTANANKDQYALGEAITLNVEALNLYGPPAVGRKYEVELTVNRKSFFPEHFHDYSFDISGFKGDFIRELREGVTDEKGTFKEVFNPVLQKLSGAYTGSVFTTVFDENGRPVNRLNQFSIYAQNVFLGIKQHDYWFSVSKPIRFELAAVNASGSLSNANDVRTVIERSYYETVQTRSSENSRIEYQSQRRTEIVYDKKMSVNGKDNAVIFTPKISGSYELRLYLPESENYTASSFYCYGYEATSNSSFAVDKEGNIKIELDKKEYETSEKAKILFTAPFSGKLLVTIERDHVLDYFWLTLDNKTTSLNLDLKNDYLPNCYITATAFRDLGETNAAPLTIARGYENMTVRNRSDKIALKIEAPEKSRSGKRQTIKLKGTPNSVLTVAVVDEGILQITRHQTPDPYDYFYGKRALETQSFDLYPWLFREASFGKSSMGGDMAFSMDQMINPLQNKRVKLVSFWSGPIVTNNAGLAEFSVDIPQFSGNLRVMAVSWKGKAFGSESANIIVADPIVISNGIPRFLSPGDQPRIPVVLRNTTDKETTVKVSLTTSSLLSVQGEQEASVKIKANGEATCFFNVIAKNDIGTAFIEVKAQAFSEIFTEKTDISIRPATGFTSSYDGGIVNASMPVSVDVGKDFVPSTVSSNIMLSRNLAAQYSGNLSEVMFYPYGCLEQTTSRAFPLLYLDDLAASVEKAKTSGQTPRFVINESIKRIMSMQNVNGGLNYWPGESASNMWSECYAAHFLTEAMKAGYSVDFDFMNRLLLHIAAYSKKQQWDNYSYWDEPTQSYKWHKKIAKTSIYGLYVLALNGRQEITQMNFHKGAKEGLTPDMRCMLAVSFAAIGDMPSCNQLLNDTETLPKTLSSSGGDFSSSIRNNALMLLCLIEYAPNDARIPVLTRQLNNAVKKTRYLSTQENAFTLLVFGKLAKKAATNAATATITLNEKNIANFDGKDFNRKGETGETGKLTITAQGSGDLYYFVETSGITKTGLKETDNNLKLRRRILDRNGKEVDLLNIVQGDLLYVELTIQTTNTLTVENVAIQDILPACFEIENARLTNVQQRSFMKLQQTPDYQDIRDDRITFFSAATPTTSHFYYAVRAVSPGTYIMGAASATAMYDGDYTSIYGQNKIIVK